MLSAAGTVGGPDVGRDARALGAYRAWGARKDAACARRTRAVRVAPLVAAAVLGAWAALRLVA